MKVKLSSVWRIGIALVLVLSFSLVMAAPAAAATAVSAVSVAPLSRIAAASTNYTITMTTVTALVGGLDTISIVFPTGMTPAPSISATDIVKINSNSLSAVGKYVVSGQRVQLEVPVTVAAATTFDVVLGGTDTITGNVTNPAAGSYQMTVYTSKDTTAVLSTAFVIGGSSTCKSVLVSVALSPYTVGVASAYTITINTDTASLVANTDNITITFPSGTTVPPSITLASSVTVDGTALDNATDYVGNATTRVVTLTVPETKVATSNIVVVFLLGANIKNPTIVATPTFTVYTTQEMIPSTAVAQSATLVAGTGSQLVLASPTTFDWSPNVARTVTVNATDSYGNRVLTSSENIRYTTTSATGTFDGDFVHQEVMSSGVGTVVYLDTTAGTYTLTIRAVDQTTYTNNITQVITVNSKAALYHAGTLVASFNTIQLAIDAAVAGDTIKASAGTYIENLTISKVNLTLESTAGKATTFIQGIMTVKATGNGFVLGGADGKGFTLKKAGTDEGMTALVNLRESPDDVTISYNTLDTGNSDLASYGILIWHGAVAGLTVTQNAFIIGDQWDNAIRGSRGDGGKVSGLTVTYNTFTGTDKTLETSGVEINKLDISSTNTTISGNTFTAIEFAVAIGSDQAGDGLVTDSAPGTLEISSNNFTSGWWGISLIKAYASGDQNQNIVIKQNTFTSNTYGIAIDKPLVKAADDNWQPGDFTIRYNDFSGNTYAIYNDASLSESANATHNYWGSSAGPMTTDNPSTTGDALSTKVVYSPWLAASQATVVASGKSQYAISVKLSYKATVSGGTTSGGWNTFSTPILLDGSHQTWSQLSSNLTYNMAYAWDSTALSGAGNFVVLTSSTVINPLDAIFVQLITTAPQSIPIVYSTALGVAPTKNVHATLSGSYSGWELIGLANLADMSTTIALASLGTAKYSQVIDPISGDVVTSGTLVVGKGYWVFITSNGTLAGFSVTPVTWVAVP